MRLPDRAARLLSSPPHSLFAGAESLPDTQARRGPDRSLPRRATRGDGQDQDTGPADKYGYNCIGLVMLSIGQAQAGHCLETA